MNRNFTNPGDKSTGGKFKKTTSGKTPPTPVGSFSRDRLVGSPCPSMVASVEVARERFDSLVPSDKHVEDYRYSDVSEEIMKYPHEATHVSPTVSVYSFSNYSPTDIDDDFGRPNDVKYNLILTVDRVSGKHIFTREGYVTAIDPADEWDWEDDLHEFDTPEEAVAFIHQELAVEEKSLKDYENSVFYNAEIWNEPIVANEDLPF